MREVIIIEKDELVGLSILIAENIIESSKQIYGFTMHLRDTKKEMSEDAMLGMLAPVIRRALKQIGQAEK